MHERLFGPVRFIPGKKNGKYPYCHSVYIEGPKILIDPASDRERLIRLKEESGVDMVWLSHWHEDHISDLDLFEDVPLWISEADADPLSDSEIFLDWYGMKEGEFRDGFRDVLVQQFHFKPRKADRFLTGGETLAFKNMTVDVIAAPGHTPGHTAFFFREPKVLFLGDYDLTRFGPWYGDRDSDIDDVLASVDALRQISADVWLSCHETGVFLENPGKLWTDYLGVIHYRDDRLMKLLETPKTLNEIIDAGIVYNRPGTTESFFTFGEWAIMTKHLERNIDKGLVRYHENRYMSV
ncbi:MAG: MBL fold metallo-hydrolase [Desulfobacterales bacterium]